MKNKTKASLLFACLLVLAACTGPTQFTSSLGEPGTTGYDPRLLGTWYSATEDGYEFVSIRPGEDQNLLATYLGQGVSKLQLQVHASDLDGTLYYNATPTPSSYFKAFPDAEEIPYFVLAQIEFLTDDILHVWWSVLNASVIGEGRKVSAGNGSYLLLEISREELQGWIRGASPGQFLNARTGPFYRLRNPPEKSRAIIWFVDDRSGCRIGLQYGDGFAIASSLSESSVKWSGNCAEGMASGQGLLELKMSEKDRPFRYEGPLVEGLPHGAGRCQKNGADDWEPCNFESGIGVTAAGEN